MNVNIALAVLVFWPFVGGLLCYAAGTKNERFRDYLADFVAVSELFLHCFCCQAPVRRGAHGFRKVLMLRASADWGFILRWTGFGRFM